MSERSAETFAELLNSPDGIERAVQGAVREALIEHHKAGQPVPTWRDGKVVWVKADENGRYADEV